MKPRLFDDDKIRNMSEDLLAFVHRVSLNEKATPAELAVLPEIVKIIYKVANEIH